jgi:hypothetical protein
MAININQEGEAVPSRTRARCGRLIWFAIAISMAGSAFAQSTNSSDLRGTVTDPTGSVVPGVSVDILNTDTGVTRRLTTNADGLYDAVSILPGHYQLAFSKEGFDKLIRKGIDLTVGAVTVNATLNVGATQQEISVSEQVPLLHTDTAEQSATFESQSMQEMPNVSRDWANFVKILPGASAQGTSSGSPGTTLSINGTMPNYDNFLADGASVTLPHSANVNNNTFESIAEVQINTSTFTAQYGTGAAVFNQISKSGSNQWHGSVYEFLQNDFFNARSFFSPSVPNKRYDMFGGAVGGPIRKDKLFFFFNPEKIINNSVSYPIYTYPTADMRAGNFSNSIFPVIYDPSSLGASGVRTPFPGNMIPASRLDSLATAVQQYMPAPNSTGYVNNYQTALASTNPQLRWFGRIDYNPTTNNRVTFSIMQQDFPSFGALPACPVNCYKGDTDWYDSQITDVWSLTPTTVNEFRFGFTRQGNWYTPESLGQNYPQKLGWNYAQANLFPQITINGSVCCASENGATAVLNPGPNAIYAENSFDPSDTVTMIRGKHILHFGAELLFMEDNDTPWGNINSGNFTFSGVFTQQGPFNSMGPGGTGNSGLAYADFLLGQVDSWSATNSPIIAMRQFQPQFFVQDDYKVTPTLTLNLGLRYQIMGGWHDLHNRVGGFDPTIINPVTNTPGAMWFAPGNGRNSIEKPNYNIWLPRVGFAWSAMKNTVIRGGFGIYGYMWSEDTYAAGSEGFGANASGSLSETTQTQPVFAFSNSNPALNYVNASKNPGAYNGQSVNYYPYNTPVAKNYQWSFSVERQLPHNMVVSAAYVGNHVNGLSNPVDTNQVPYNLVGTSSNPQSLRPFPQFQKISGNLFNAISNYNSMQLTIRKRFSSGLSFDANYTWSKFLSTQDSSGWGGNGGTQVYQIANLPGINYGLSNFDRPQMFTGDVVYQLPVGKSRRFFSNANALVDGVLGGWQASAIFTAESGTPFTPVIGTQNLTGAITGNWYPNVVGNPYLSNPTIQQWFNPAAFAQPAAFTFGNEGRNILRGPDLTDIDFSMGKNFAFPVFNERANLQIRFDATNILNHPSFANPNVNIGTPNAGIITSTTVNGRALQLGARFSF